jgi:formate C-acetyltransferase
LAAIKKLVFDESKITMSQLCDALNTNFEGHDELRQMLLEAPKFGNDDEYVDEQVAWVMRVFSEEVLKQKNTRGGHKLPAQLPMSAYIPYGRIIGALPSGRLAGEPLSDGISPTRGSDTKGPTAVLKSIGRIDNPKVAAGETLNMRLDPVIFDSEDGVRRLASLIRVFVDFKMNHVQFNVVSTATLKAAQREPEKYRDLVVKVAGYNAFFVELNKDLQNAIIARTQHR